jgi:REP element-mobilizing transposase RayT
MARPLRIQYTGAVYHVTGRGNEKKEIYRDDRDREEFLEILSQSLQIYNVILHSYVQMNNHYHLLVETPLGNLGEFMRHFNITYTSYFNRRHKRTGHLYQGRYKSIIVDKEAYLTVLSRYIHLNPVRTKNTKKMPDREKKEYLIRYQWSSLPGYIDKNRKQKSVNYEMVLQEYGGDTERGRKAYGVVISDDISSGLEVKNRIVGQSILGGEDFIKMIRDRYLKGKTDRECPSVNKIKRYQAKEEIIKIIKETTGKDIKAIKAERDVCRQILMDLMYRAGGMTGVEIGRVFGVDYSTVSQSRRRLREKMKNDCKLGILMKRIEDRLSI